MNILITGVSSGIGKALIQLLDKTSHHVLGVSRNQEKLNEISSGLTNKNIKLISVDLSSNDLSKVNNVLSEWNHLDILINNAGLLINKPFESLKPKDFLDVYQVNLFSIVSLTQLCLPYLKKSNIAHTLNISSMGGVQGSLKFPGLAAYSSAKMAVVGLTECLAEEYKDTTLKFNTLALGAVQTEMLEKAFPGYKAPLSANQMAEYILSFALKNHEFMNGKLIEVSLTTP